MKRIAILAAAVIGSVTAAAPAQAQLLTLLSHTHYCNCGHSAGSAMCGGSTSSTSSTTSGGTTSTTSGGTTSTSSTTSGGTTTSTGGTSVPEPGMLGMMGLGFIGIAVARRRRRA